MRGEYFTTNDDRRRFFHALNEICREKEYEVNLISSQLCLRDCLFLLGELGYEQNGWDVDAGEGDIWVSCYCEEMPKITLLSDGYLGRLKMFLDDEATYMDKEKIKELMRENWGKYFPVI